MVEGPVPPEETEPLMVVPPTFALLNQPFDYNFMQHTSRGGAADHRAPGLSWGTACLETFQSCYPGKKRARRLEYKAGQVPPYPYPHTLPQGLYDCPHFVVCMIVLILLSVWLSSFWLY